MCGQSPEPLFEPPAPPTAPVLPRRGARVQKEVHWYGFLAKAMFLGTELFNNEMYPTLKAMVATTDPKKFRDATRGVNKKVWLATINSEMESLLLNKVFDLVPLPEGKQGMGCWWHFRTKAGENGLPGRKEVRLVAKGHL